MALMLYSLHDKQVLQPQPYVGNWVQWHLDLVWQLPWLFPSGLWRLVYEFWFTKEQKTKQQKTKQQIDCKWQVPGLLAGNELPRWSDRECGTNVKTGKEFQVAIQGQCQCGTCTNCQPQLFKF